VRLGICRKFQTLPWGSFGRKSSLGAFELEGLRQLNGSLLLEKKNTVAQLSYNFVGRAAQKAVIAQRNCSTNKHKGQLGVSIPAQKAAL